jgi:hypothetical protein
MVDSANSDAVVIENGVFTVRPGTYLFHPVFAKQQLRAGQTCEIQVVDAVVRNFMIGVATTDLRNKTHEYKDINSLCLFAYNGTLFSNGN